MKRSSVYFSDEQSNSLEAKARELGFLQTRGTGAGKVGSISQLVRAIADGKIKLTEPNKEKS